MNRFNKGNWSMVQNSMVMAFLSYADFYRCALAAAATVTTETVPPCFHRLGGWGTSWVLLHPGRGSLRFLAPPAVAPTTPTHPLNATASPRFSQCIHPAAARATSCWRTCATL